VTAIRSIALVGDYSAEKIAHRAIPLAIDLAGKALGIGFSARWVPTANLRSGQNELEECAGVWVVPGSPYANMGGVLDVIRWARESGRPLLGTCGGFQHALIEIARHAAGLPEADHAETNPDAATAVVTALSCSLVEQSGRIHFAPGSRLSFAYGADSATEGYRCSYGLNPHYRAALETAGLRFTAWDDAGDVRGAELPSHPFFVGTLFQPERAALAGRTPPLVAAFLAACRRGR
jgi:CTP synthase (UTP-ammonia lyase)